MKRCLAFAALIACALGVVGATQEPERGSSHRFFAALVIQCACSQR